MIDSPQHSTLCGYDRSLIDQIHYLGEVIGVLGDVSTNKSEPEILLGGAALIGEQIASIALQVLDNVEKDAKEQRKSTE